MNYGRVCEGEDKGGMIIVVYVCVLGVFMIWYIFFVSVFFFSSRRRHTRWPRDWSSDVCSSDLLPGGDERGRRRPDHPAERDVSLDQRRCQLDECKRRPGAARPWACNFRLLCSGLLDHLEAYGLGPAG